MKTDYIRFTIIFALIILFVFESSIHIYSQERIKLILANGSELYSSNNGYSWEKSRNVNSDKNENIFVCRYANNAIYIKPNIQLTGNYQFFIFDVLGNEISKNSITFVGKSYEKSIDFPNVIKGFYFWILSNGLIRYSSSFIIY